MSAGLTTKLIQCPLAAGNGATGVASLPWRDLWPGRWSGWSQCWWGEMAGGVSRPGGGVNAPRND
jgi:hypothetical protein